MKTKTFSFLNIWIIVSFLSLLLGYCLLQPRISNIIPFIRDYRLATFINNSIRNKHISPQEFWRLREFYSPGVIEFNKPNLTFTSKKVSSHESIVSKTLSLEQMLPDIRKWQILLRTKNELIAKQGDVTIVYFIKPVSEMVLVNAYYDNKDTDEIFLKNKNWFVKTIIQK